MNRSWKTMAAPLHFRRWPAMAWAMLALVIVFSAVTAIVGFQLYAMTAEHPRISTR
jgi:hypothetical protein